MSKEAMKLALEALEGIHPGNMTPMAEEYWSKAIIALREARQPAPATELREQEPVHVAFASNEAEHPEDRYIKTAHIEVKRYQDGTLAVGPTPLPDMSPVQQEPVAFEIAYARALKESNSGTLKDIAKLCYQAALIVQPAAPVSQKPSWYHKHWGDGDDIFYTPTGRIPDGVTPLYTSPQAQRTWVGLSDEEIYMNCPNWLSQDRSKDSASRSQTQGEEHMSKILIEEAKVKQVMDACEGIANADWRKWNELASLAEFERWAQSRANFMATILREALAEHPAQQEPVAVAYFENITGRIVPPDDTHRRKFPMCYRPLVFGDTSPPAQRKPLSNGEIYTAYITATNQTLRPQDERLAFAFARAIEAAHGIKENT